MAGPTDGGFQSYAPNLADTFQPRRGMVRPQGTPAPQPSGPNGVMGYVEAPVAGAYEAASQLGSAAEAGAKLFGANDAAQAAADWAARQRATAATYQSPDLEKSAWYDPRGIAYQVLKGAPVAAGMLAAGAATGGLADAGALGATAARLGGKVVGGIAAGALGYPLAVGGNVQTQEGYSGPITPEQAGKAAALGVPEAAIGAYPFARLSGMVTRGADGTLTHAMTSQAATQALASAGQDVIAQQMGDPDRPLVSRMQEMLSSALTGGATGALMGAGVHALAKTNPTTIPTSGPGSLDEATEAALTPPASTEGGVQGELPLEQPKNPDRPYQQAPQARLDQLSAYFQGIPEPDLFQQRLARDVAAEQALRQQAAQVPATTTDPNRVASPQLPEPSEPIIPQPNLAGLDQGELFPHTPTVGEAELQAINRLTGNPNQEAVRVQDARPAQPWEINPNILKPERSRPRDNPIPQPDQEDVALTDARARDIPFAEQPSLADVGELPQDIGNGFAEPAAPADPMEPLRAAAKGLKLPKPVQDAVNDPKATPAAVEAVLRDRFKASEVGGPVKGNKDTQTFAEAAGVLDNGKLTAPVDTQSRVNALDTQTRMPEPTTISEPAADKIAEIRPDLVEQAKVAMENAFAPPGAPARGRILPDLTQVAKAAEPVQASLDKLKAIQPDNAVWQAGLKAQQDKLSAITDPSRPSLSPDHFQTPLWDDHWEQVPQAARPALQKHVELEDSLLQQVDRTDPDRFSAPFARPATFGPRSQGDLDVTALVKAGGQTKPVLEHIAANGETPLNRKLAADFAARGADGPISFSDPMNVYRFRNLTPTEPAGAAYDQATGRTHLMQGSDLEQAVLHETAHRLSSDALDAGGPAAREFTQFFNDAKAQIGGDSPSENAMKDAHEFLAEGMTNPDMRAFLERQAPIGKPSLWQRFKDGVAGLLGMQGSKKTMLDQLLEKGNRVMDENSTARGLPPGTPPGVEMHGRPATDDRLKTPQGLEQVTHNVVAASEAYRDRLASLGDSVKVGAQKALLLARNGPDIANAAAERFGIKSAPRFLDAQMTNDARLNTWSKADAVPLRALKALSDEGRARFARVADATRIGVDARKAAEDLPLAVRKSPDHMKEYRQARGDYMAMSPEEKSAYDQNVAMNQGHRAFALAQSLENYARDLKLGEKGLTSGFGNDMGAERQFDNEAHDNPFVARDKAVQQFGQRLAGIRDFLDTAKSAKLDPELRVRLETMHRLSAAEMEEITKGVPYFRSGREGDFYVSGKLKLGADGLPDQTAIDRLRPMLDEKGFCYLALNRLLDNPQLYARVETREQAQRLENVFRAAQEAGGILDDSAIGSGLAEELTVGQRPTMLNEVINAMRRNAPDTEGLTAEQAELVTAAHERSVTEVTRHLMDVLPNSAQAKVSAQRKDVQLYTKDIETGLRQGAQSYGRLLANMSTVGEKGAAMAAMREEMKALKKDPNVSVTQKELAQNLVSQLLLRDAKRPDGAPNGFIAATKGVSYLFELASPGYLLTLLSQNFTLGLPELASRIGGVSAAKSTARVSGDMIRAMKGAMSGPDWASAGLRLDPLLKAGLSQEKAEMLVRADNRGKMTSAAFTHMLMGPAEEGGGAREQLARVSTAYTRFCELQPRIHMALAAADGWRGVEKDGALDPFIDKVLDGSQFNYDAATMPRIMSRAGPLGELAPLMTQFWRFRTELTHKLYRSFEEGFSSVNGKTWSDADRVRARSFLYGHLAAMTVLSGTLGLPMVGVLASVADKLADWATNDPTHDIIASYRGHLKDVFGPAVGEAIARGTPRFLGADFSHLGEAKVAPGISEALMAITEKRKFEDAEKDWLKNLAGAPVGMLSTMALGMRDIANGDYLRGLQKMAPEGLRGTIEAAQIAKYGYRDKSGTPLKLNGQTLTPTAQDMVMQVMGVDPAKEEEYNEVRRTAAGLEQRRQIQSQNITQHLMLAEVRGDQDNFKYWLGQSSDYAREHPGMTPPIADLGRALQTHMRQSAMGLPPGVGARDLGARGMLGYANSHE